MRGVVIVLTFHRKIVEIGKIDIPSKHTHEHALSWPGTGTLIKSGGVKLILPICFIYM